MALFFSQRKPKGFNYKPRFYDPDTEQFHKERKIDFNSQFHRRGQRRKQRSVAILIGMLVLLVLIAWYMYF